MRASPWRSFVCLAALAVLVAACAPPLDLANRPPPCTTSYSLCDTTGICVPDAELTKPIRGSKSVCPISLTVRQGAMIVVPVPGASSDDIEIVSTDDLTANVISPAPGLAAIELSAPHGTLPGAYNKQGRQRLLKLRTTTGGFAVDRAIDIDVSPLTVAFTGNDDALGSTDQPFRTFARAAREAQAGDTIALSNGQLGGPAEDKENPAPVMLPSGVTVQGADAGGTQLFMKITVLGSATFDRLYFWKERLVIDQPQSQVIVRDCLSAKGFEVAKSAVGTNLKISGSSTELRADDGEHEPLLVAADNAVVSLEEGVHVKFNGNETLEPIHLTGQGQDLSISGATVENSAGPRAVSVEGAASVVVINATINGRLDITNRDSRAEVWTSQFRMGQGDGGIHFGGFKMLVRGSQFTTTDGIEQDNAAGHVSVHGTTFSRYPRFGYHLLAGTAELGDDVALGNNLFNGATDRDPEAWPTALFIEATGARMTVSESSFDVPPPPPPCEFRGPGKITGLYRISDDTSYLHFYE